MLYSFPFGTAIILCSDSLSAQRALLSIQRALGNFPGCGRWGLNSRSVTNCKENPQISWRLLLLIVWRRDLPDLVTCHSVLCCVWPLALHAIRLPSLCGQQDKCSLGCFQHVYSQKRGHTAQTTCILRSRDPHSLHKLKNIHPYQTNLEVPADALHT